jgi:hypothetical protein
VLDVSEPSQPVEVGFYDTFDEDGPDAADPIHSLVGSRFDGAWGVWPYGPHVAVGDMRRGLILLDYFPDEVCSG